MNSLLSHKGITLVLSLFDQKESAAKVRKAKLGYDASGVLRYLARLELLPGPYAPPLDITQYIVRDGAVAAVEFGNFNTKDLASKARELEGDALRAGSRIGVPWVHGCLAVKVAPEDFTGEYKELIDLAKDLLRLLGVDKNRYIVAVHVDSGHIHVHFFYSRIGPDGELRERDRRHPKFMAEEACATLADKYGFDLEDRHLSRVINGQIVDLASRAVVRDQNFDEKPAGMKRRNEARKKVGKDDLYKLALVGDHIAKGDLNTFRRHLAKHGYLYEPAGSGAEFERLDGSRSPASHLDYRFSKGRVLGGACADSLPPTPPDIMRLAKSRRPLPHDADAEFERVIADRSDVGKTVSDAVKDSKGQERWDRAVKAAMKEDRRGRPPPAPELLGWPRSMHVEGVLGAASRKPARMMFPQPYQVQEREWQTEVLRGNTLIATVRYSRMAILSKREEDLRASLLAAKAAWGTVEVIGNPKFKQRMAALAAELGVSISNPELADTMAIARKRHDPLPLVTHPAASVAQSDVAPAGIPEPVTVNSDNAMPQAIGGTTSDMSAAPDRGAQAKAPEIGTEAEASPIAARSASTSLEEQISSPTPVPIERSTAAPVNTSATASRLAMLSESIVRNNWEVTTTFRDHVVTMVLEPRTMRGFRITEEDLIGPAMQRRLKILHDQQQLDHTRILELVASGSGELSPISSPYGKDPLHVKLETDDRRLSELFSRCQHHDKLHQQLHELFQKQLREREEVKQRRRHSLDGGRIGLGTRTQDDAIGEKVREAKSSPAVPGTSEKEDIAKKNSPTVVAANFGAHMTPSPTSRGAVDESLDPAEKNRPPNRAEPSTLPGPSEASGFERSEGNQREVPPHAAYSAAYAAELADIKRPRVLGERATVKGAGADKAVPENAGLKPAKAASHSVVSEPPKSHADVGRHQEAAKAASALGKQI